MMRTLLLLTIAAAAVATGSPAAQSQPALFTTIVIVRHAEAVPNAGPDPVLSDAGIARANALAAALKDAGVAGVFTTQYQRTALTGQAVATATTTPLVKTTIAGGAAGLDGYVKQMVGDVIARYAGRAVVIVGHSNTVPALVRGFTGAEVGEIAHDSFDQMFVVTTSAAGTGRVVRARY